MLSDEPLNDINRAQRRPGAQAGSQPWPPKSAVFGALAAQADPRAQRRRLRSRRIQEKFSGESKDGYLSSLSRATAARLGVEAPPARRAHFLDPRRARREAPRRIARAKRSQCKKHNSYRTVGYVARLLQEKGRAGNAMCAR
jgi:hypothetical protein